MLKKHAHQSGFTIVELLIVIVVIGILAAITIVAFNGVTNKAKVSAAQTDLENSNKQLEIAKATNNSLPTAIDCSATPAADTICLKASNGASYNYYVNNTVSPAAYCLTTTNGSTVYSQSTANPAPTSGACPTVYNLATNPSLETATTNWGAYAGPTPAAVSTGTSTTGGAAIGSSFYRAQWTTAATTGSGGVYAYSNVASAGQTFTVSGYVRSNKARTMNVSAEWYNASSTSLGKSSSSNIDIPANTWTRVSVKTDAAPANTTKFTATFYKLNDAIPFALNDTFDVDGLMVTTGSTLYSYADGSSPNWTWSGTPGTSQSSGIGM